MYASGWVRLPSFPLLGVPRRVTWRDERGITGLRTETKIAEILNGTGDPGGSRTPNPQIRSLMLYPIELRGRMVENFGQTHFLTIR